jgi:hypothetical protein
MPATESALEIEGSYTEEEGTTDEIGSSIGPGSGGPGRDRGGAPLLRLFRMLHRRGRTSRCSRLPPPRPQGTARVPLAALHLRSAAAGGRETRLEVQLRLRLPVAD